MKKKQVISYILCIFTLVNMFAVVEGQLVQVQATDGTHCESSSICGMAPKEFDMLLNFTNEIANSIQTIGTQGKYLGKYVNPNRFKGFVFEPPQSSSLTNRLYRNTAQKLKFSLASSLILLDLPNAMRIKDLGGGLILSTKNYVFIRDAKRVLDTESLLTDKKYELGMGGYIYEKIREENINIMQNIITSYQNKGLLTQHSAISKDATYEQVISALTQVTSSLKTFLYIDTIGQLEKTSRGGSSVFFTIEYSALENMKKEYSCARGFWDACNNHKKSFISSMKSTWNIVKKGFVTGSGGFVDVGKNANKRLMEIFSPSSKQSEEYKQKEADLLVSMYGTTIVPKHTSFANFLENNSSSIKKSGSGVGAQFSTFATDVAHFWIDDSKDLAQKSKDIQNNKEREGKTPPATIVSTKQTQEIALQNIFRASLEDVFVAQSADITLASLVEVQEITRNFSLIAQQISIIKNDILGGKNKDGSLIKLLGEACELQCGGGGSCRK